MNAGLTLTSIRPAPGRVFVRAWFCADLGMLPSKRHQRPNPMHFTPAHSPRARADEDQLPPGGGSA
ncbi:hypothetical protein VAPA_2c11040 [Variovorax paradoxus B4]|uniref:Uncharacterized protein n=1 Tax=Variovorax paradoxus B4 TaxID=1246301 RepID=T1XM38_VARPD|nr:hypothetical protein VAPA_2c11040 [Variovorax paradoxus B4]